MFKNFKFTILNILAVFFMLYGIGLLILVGYTVGNLMVFLLGLSFLFLELSKDKLPKNKLIKTAKILIYSSYFVVSALVIFLMFSFGVPKSETNEDAVIVLGCGLIGSEVSVTLERRLLACIEYYHKNPEALIVVSGGQGFSEEIPEAVAMENYLLRNGIPKEKIIKEDASHSTFENFENSKKILDKTFENDNYTVAFITNRFHCYRSYNLAKNAGLETTCYPAIDEWRSAFPSYLRESLAAIKLWLFGI